MPDRGFSEKIRAANARERFPYDRGSVSVLDLSVRLFLLDQPYRPLSSERLEYLLKLIHVVGLVVVVGIRGIVREVIVFSR